MINRNATTTSRLSSETAKLTAKRPKIFPVRVKYRSMKIKSTQVFWKRCGKWYRYTCTLLVPLHHHQRLYSPNGPWPPLLRFRNQFLRHAVWLLGRVISSSQGLYLHITTHHIKTKDKHPCPNAGLEPTIGRMSAQSPRLRPRDHWIGFNTV
jgi:hypothetical protein